MEEPVAGRPLPAESDPRRAAPTNRVGVAGGLPGRHAPWDIERAPGRRLKRKPPGAAARRPGRGRGHPRGGDPELRPAGSARLRGGCRRSPPLAARRGESVVQGACLDEETTAAWGGASPSGGPRCAVEGGSARAPAAVNRLLHEPTVARQGDRSRAAATPHLAALAARLFGPRTRSPRRRRATPRVRRAPPRLGARLRLGTPRRQAPSRAGAQARLGSRNRPCPARSSWSRSTTGRANLQRGRRRTSRAWDGRARARALLRPRGSTSGRHTAPKDVAPGELARRHNRESVGRRPPRADAAANAPCSGAPPRWPRLPRPRAGGVGTLVAAGAARLGAGRGGPTCGVVRAWPWQRRHAPAPARPTATWDAPGARGRRAPPAPRRSPSGFEWVAAGARALSCPPPGAGATPGAAGAGPPNAQVAEVLGRASALGRSGLGGARAAWRRAEARCRGAARPRNVPHTPVGGPRGGRRPTGGALHGLSPASRNGLGVDPRRGFAIGGGDAARGRRPIALAERPASRPGAAERAATGREALA